MGIGAPVRRRSNDGGCQWLTIGAVLGMGCSFVLFLTSYVFGFIRLGEFESASPNTPLAAIVVVTSQVSASPFPPTQAVAVADLEAFTPVPSTPDLSVTPTLLGGGLTPTPLPEVAGGANPTPLPQGAPQVATSPATLASGANPTAEIGTPVPLPGEPTRTPALSSNNATPSPLLALASPLVAIPGGTFTMGTTREEGLKAVDECVTRDGGACQESYIQDATPTHQVTLDDFQIEAYEVSATQYVAFLNQLLAQFPGLRVDLVGCNGQPCVRVQADEPNSIVRFNGTQYELVNPTFYANHPIFFVTWWGADAYCTSLGRRLPTEAEWERAARGPANSIYPWGAEWIPANANTSRSNLQPGTVPVDSFPSGLSAYGVYNMAGNVAEWVWDFYQENYYSLPEAVGPNPRGPAVSDRKVLRGGGWDNVPLFARTVHRMYADPKSGRASLGFRCAADAP